METKNDFITLIIQGHIGCFAFVKDATEHIPDDVRLRAALVRAYAINVVGERLFRLWAYYKQDTFKTVIALVEYSVEELNEIIDGKESYNA